MKKLILHLVVAIGIVGISSTVSAETKKVNLSAGLKYVLSQVVTKGDNNQSNHNMGMLYYLGKKGVPVDHKKAAEWFSKAAANGFSPSQYALAVMYLNGDGVPQDAEKGVTLLQSAARQGQPEAVKLYNTLQAKAQQLNAIQTPSVQTATTAIKYYDTSKLEPKNFKQVVLPNLSTDTIARSFYKVASSREREKDDYWGSGKYYYVNKPSDLDDLTDAVISIAPIFTYQNMQGEARYLVPVEVTLVIEGRIETSHVTRGTLELYLFKKLDNGQFQMVSKTAQGGVESIEGYGRTSWNAQEFKKNLQAFGNNTLGSYNIDGYYGNGYGESVWSLLLLNEEGYIFQQMFEEGKISEQPEYGYSSAIQVKKNGQPFYPFQIHYQGTDMNDNNRMVKVNKILLYQYDSKSKFYSKPK
ncbi:Sel1 repeat-containing protein [Acinetobacter sp. BIGb0102]|uniref:tetratricopeptide repeat protein n=1 Tax=Acinetobacter sp. BIGb0102 TaxID=2485131 RepID=UPI000F4E3D75|nr:tetratricopeptide repeat protein [Acinetobacter sp. BIGb0102]RPE28285.1 Sel1 repeat-containing protein [Acinetobacter sp. BIGb0102]